MDLPREVIFTVTVIDNSDPDIPDYRRIPAIFTDLAPAIELVKNNDQDIAESGENRYVVIEETLLNTVLPPVNSKIWFEWSWDLGRYELTDVPTQFTKVPSFGIS